MNDSSEKRGSGSVVVNIIVGIAVVSGVVWLVMHCPTCH